MSIPPFPSQDLAKLVLGYLAEEQLMTAYDEFLQASPYLDALQNEYDRIFMTSLKSILAEYRAVKIYVETCKPILLRRKVFQCTNLLDIVKLLVNNVDLNKLQEQEAADKANVEKQQFSANASKTNCETCASSKLATCVCSKQRTLLNQPSQEGSLQNSIETTPLADLPGNHVTTRKKQMKVLDKDSVIFSDGQSSSCREKELSNVCTEESKIHSIQAKNDVSTVSLNSTVKTIDPADSRQKIEEFDNVLKLVLDKKSTVTGSDIVPNQRVSNVNTFQDFASGVSGGESSNVPDSSTSENMSTQASLTKDYFKDNAISQKRQLLLQVSHENMEIQTYRRDKDKTLKYAKIKAKPDDQNQKVKIISDVKVTNKKKMLKNATSTPVTTTPLVQMRTIVINGNSAYSHAPVITKHTYTKDEIMAMPTLIVVPASGAPKISTSSNSKAITSQSHNTANTAIPTPQPLGPLVIDVPPTPGIVNKPEDIAKITEFNKPENVEAGLVKTVDLAKNASVPKDNITGSTKTPQVLPPVRKSSSTPRRTTHVRVLDFTTPRRILHETNNEQVTSQTSDAPVEIVLSSSPNVSFVDTIVADNATTSTNTTAIYNNAIAQKTDGCDTDTGSAKENNTTTNNNPPKKSNWDADLRAIVAHDSALPSKITKRRSSSKKKRPDKTEKRASCSTNSSNVKKATKKRRKVNDEDEDNPPDTTRPSIPEVTVKPTINIISGNERVVTDMPPAVQESQVDEIQNKEKCNEDECNDTPDGDRLSLQNVIGARLNISDLLETPYKQALYDIQMGTPRFLPDLPGEPLSDIKITNIPTPRFLDTPKAVQATPSSWSSRPTDYSSGGSYYKPDDQDYMPIPDLRCVVSSSSKEDITSDKSVDIPKEDEKKSRPQRQCTKNVSYYRLANPSSKPKEPDDTIDTASTCSDSTTECKNKETLVKTPRDRSRPNKSEARKRVTSRKRKSPAVKEKPKPFVKIKPRQTPTKLTPSRNRKKTDIPGYPSPNKIRRNRTISKNLNSTPPTVDAPTKSRRKSSTPRKLHCTKSFNSENSTHTSPSAITDTKPGQNLVHVTTKQILDSDTDQIALRWSDDGSQDTKVTPAPQSSSNECEDITQIQEYIQSTSNRPAEGSFQVDLMKRGFDQVTAEKIKRDLLDTPPLSYVNTRPPQPIETVQSKNVEQPLERTIETDSSSATIDLLIVQDDDEEEEDEVELSVHECNEESQNYFVFQHDDTKEISQEPSIRLKDTFSMNICIDDGVTVRLRATAFSFPLDQDPIGVEEIDYSYNDKETEMAVNSISNIDRLYTPLKNSFKAQCYEIFDSTLTSIDTPLKATSPKRADCSTTVTDFVLEEDQVPKDKTELKKRKRSSGSVESTSDSKKTKYLLTSASIQNIDIESVLTKLHGP